MKKQGDLKLDDIKDQLPEYLKAENGRLQQVWDQALVKSSWSSIGPQQVLRGVRGGTETEKRKRKPSLFWAIVRADGIYFGPLIFTRIVRPAATFAVPFILNLFLGYLQDVRRSNAEDGGDQEGKKGPSLEYGLFLAMAMFLTTLASAILLVVNRDQAILHSLHTKSQLVSLIYQKSLRLSPGARHQQLQQNSKGKGSVDKDKGKGKDTKKKTPSSTTSITNLMSVDAEVWSEGFIFLSMWISLPIEIGLSLYLLYDLLGWSAWVGLAFMVALTPVQIYRAKVFAKMQRLKLGHMDDRIRVTTEVLSAIKVVKLYCWESTFLQRILGHRNKELHELKRISIIYAFMSIIYTSSNLVICLLTFSVFVIWGGELTPQTVFVSMALFGMLRIPISNISDGISATINLAVATKRIENFLLLEEIDPEAVERIPEDVDTNTREPGEVVVALADATFSWTSQPETDAKEDIDEESQALLSTAAEETASFSFRPTLQNIHLLVTRESLVAIVGKVGEGKSSLLSAIIGEMYKLQGHVRTKGQIAYVPQQPWILNMSLRENILFGKPMDQERYRAVLFACGLEPDLDLLPAGDMTEIGERGINLSGGQKQRVSLARAAYQDADIYLLDDPLSAVDAHVDQHLWREVIGPTGLLRNKTRLLVTHGIHHLKEMDQILVIKEGAIDESGGYDELMTQGHIFSRLILDYAVEHRRAKKQGKESADELSASEESSIAEGTIGTKDSAISKASVEVAKDVRKDAKAELITKEKMEDGNVSWKVFMTYIRAVSYKNAILVTLFLILTQTCLIGTNLWLKYWINLTERHKEDEEAAPSLGLFLTVFALLTLGYILVCIAMMWIVFAVARIRAAEHLHRVLIERVLRLPAAFFDTTPLGRILNRVSGDIAAVDERVPSKLYATMDNAVILTASLIIVAVTTPIFLIALPFFILAFGIVGKIYMKASRSCKRIESVARSPIFQHFTESLGGLSTIRAMHVQDRFKHENEAKINLHMNAYVVFVRCFRWKECRIQLMTSLIVLLTAVWFVVAPRGSVDASTAGLALSFAMSITNAMIWFVRNYCDLQNQLVAVERIQEYAEMKPEAPLDTEEIGGSSEAERALKHGWPAQGSIVFDNYSTRYREGLDLVLKGVSFAVRGGEKVAIVGRTGAGKSSLTLALFRMIEAADSHWAR
ncbi:hypothetical protein BGZ83_002504, partial [Gryganskiella cystojenkinii]